MASGDLERQIAMWRAQGLQPMPMPIIMQQPQQVLQPVIDHAPLPDDIEARFVSNDKDHQAIMQFIDQLVGKLADQEDRIRILEDKVAAFEMGVRDARAA